MGRNADFRQPQHDELGDTVVDHTLTGDRTLFLIVEGGRVVLEELNERAWLRPLKEDFGLAFIYLPAPTHGGNSCF